MFNTSHVDILNRKPIELYLAILELSKRTDPPDLPIGDFLFICATLFSSDLRVCWPSSGGGHHPAFDHGISSHPDPLKSFSDTH